MSKCHRLHELAEDILAATHWSIRAFRREPRFVIVVSSVLGIGIGSCLTIFSVVNAYLFHPLPVPRPSELVRIGMIARSLGRDVEATMPYALFEEIRRERRAFADGVAYSAGDV